MCSTTSCCECHFEVGSKLNRFEGTWHDFEVRELSNVDVKADGWVLQSRRILNIALREIGNRLRLGGASSM